MPILNVLFRRCLAVLGLVLGVPASAFAQAPIERPVTLVVLEGYPAFRSPAEQAHPNAREIRAFGFRQDPVHRDRATIVINPAHLSVQTLADALRALAPSGPSTGQAPPRNSIALGASERGRRVPPRLAAILSSKIADLMAQQSAAVPELGGTGRKLSIGLPSDYLSADQ